MNQMGAVPVWFPCFGGHICGIMKKKRRDRMQTEQEILTAIAREVSTLPGHLGFYYKNLVTGAEYGIREEEPFLAASVIKFPLFLHILRECQRGTLSLEDRLSVSESQKMPSCGALTLFTGEVEADIQTLCRLMIALSDNTATNVLIGHCTIPAVNHTFRELGLSQTVLRRLLFDSGASRRGLENTVSPKEMGCLLEQLYRGTFVSPEVSRLALDTLLLQQIGHKLDGKLQGQIPIAHKTGEDDALSNDVGLLFAPQPFLLCFTGHDTDCYLWEDLIRRAAFQLVQCQTGEGQAANA